MSHEFLEFLDATLWLTIVELENEARAGGWSAKANLEHAREMHEEWLDWVYVTYGDVPMSWRTAQELLR